MRACSVVFSTCANISSAIKIVNMATGKRFASLTVEEIEEIESNQDSSSTKKCVEKSVRAFRSFLTEKDINPKFEELPTADLDSALKSFYANARTVKGELYKVSSFTQLKYGLQKYLLIKGIDTTGVSFQQSAETFKAMKKELTKSGKGDIKHRNPISENDLKRLYEHRYAFKTLTPVGLQQKVLFELILYTCRRGQENIHSMTKDFYGVKTDDDGREYVVQQKSEVDKNHSANRKSNDTTGEGRMYSQLNCPTCPVASYKLYLSKLHLSCKSLWQRPLDSFDDESDTWYCNSPVGKNIIQNFMLKLSRYAKLSEEYTNHSIRATSITLMDDAGLEARHIMRVSGHRSESSIRSYSDRLSSTKKREISDVIATKLTGQSGKLPYHDDIQDQVKKPRNGPNLQMQVKHAPAAAAGSFDQQCREVPDIPEVVYGETTDFLPLVPKTVTGSNDLDMWENIPDELLLQCHSASSSTNRTMTFAPVFNNCANVTINFTNP